MRSSYCNLDASAGNLDASVQAPVPGVKLDEFARAPWNRDIFAFVLGLAGARQH